MRYDEYVEHDMLGLADLIARREVSAPEVLEAALSRMAEVNPLVNAVVVDLSKRAREEAAGPLDGPLAGVPYLLKDHAAQLAGTPTSVASKIFSAVIPAEDSAIVAALRGAGLVIFGKTNLPELSLGLATESRLYGPARNPWNLDRSCAGSSGGSAAAVAAGIVPAAHGSDGSGSIRVPAAWTGLFGLKPSRGRVSYAPAREGGAGTVVQHALTRSVRDSAMLLDIVCRPQPGDPYWLEPPQRPFLEEVSRAPGVLRIGFSTGAFTAPGISRECADAVLDAARLCEELGHQVEEVELPNAFPFEEARIVSSAAVAAGLDAEAKRRGQPIGEEELELLAWRIYEAGKSISAISYLQALQGLQPYVRKVHQFSSAFDVILTATSGMTAVRIGEATQDLPDFAKWRDLHYRMQPNTPVANITGEAAMTVPLAWSATGLPIGIHFSARMGGEATLFRLAGQLEQARPWWGHRAPIAAPGAA